MSSNGQKRLWVCVLDKNSGKKYYFNRKTKETVWKKPKDYVEPDWIETIDPKTKKKYYFNKKTKETSWVKPDYFRPAALGPKKGKKNNSQGSDEPGSTSEPGEPGAPATPGAPSNGATPGATPGRPTPAKKGKKRRKHGWREAKDKNTGKVYYFHTKTKEVSWVKPKDYVPPTTPQPKGQVVPPSPASSSTKRSPSPRRKMPNKPPKSKASSAGAAARKKSPPNQKRSLPPKKPRATPGRPAKLDAGNDADGVSNGADAESESGISEPKPLSRSESTTVGDVKPLSRDDGFWRTSKDKATKRMYYYHTGTKEVRWEQPEDYDEELDKSMRKKKKKKRRSRKSSENTTTSKEGDDGPGSPANSDASFNAAIQRGDAAGANVKLEDAQLSDSDNESVASGAPKTELGSVDVADRNRLKTIVTVEQGGKAVPQFNMEIDIFSESFKLLPKTTDEDLLLKRLNMLDIPNPDKDPRVAPVINRKKGLFYHVGRILRKYHKSEKITAVCVRLLKRFGSLEEFVVKAVENDVVGRAIAVIPAHTTNKEIVGDAVILLGNLALNEYVKELIRMEDGVKVVAMLMIHPEHINDTVILDKCCYCLANMAVDNIENVKDIISGGALKSVIRCMETFKDNEDLLDSGTVVLSNLCAGGDQHRKAIADTGAVRALVGIITDPKQNVQVLHDCLRALGNLALHQSAIAIMLSDNAVAALSTCIENFQQEPELLALAVSVIGNMSAGCGAELMRKMVAQGAVTGMVAASKAHPQDPDVQLAFFGSLANFAKGVQESDSAVDDSVMGGVAMVIKVMKNLGTEDEVIYKGLKLVQRVAQSPARTRKLIVLRVGDYLSELLAYHVHEHSNKMVREILATISALSSEVTAHELASTELVNVINALVINLVDEPKTIEQAFKTLRHLSVQQSPAVKIADICTEAVVAAVKQHRDKPHFVLHVAPLFGELAIYKGAMGNLNKYRGGALLLELLEEHTQSGDICTKILIALTNMLLSDEEFAKTLKESHAERIVNPIMKANMGNVQLRHAAQAFLTKLKEWEQIDQQQFEEMNSDRQNQLLRRKFDVPTIDQDTLNWLTAGQTITQHKDKGAPRERHTSVSRSGKFVTLREQGKAKESKQYSMRTIESIEPGCVSPALQRSYKWSRGTPATADRSFAIIGDEYTLSFEAATTEDRDVWVSSLREVLIYRRRLEERRKELTKEEEDAYF